jgi:hypothetical protein
MGKQRPPPKRNATTPRFASSNAPSALDLVIMHSNDTPSPADYTIRRPHTAGGAFSTAKPLSALDRTILRASRLPAPDAYNVAGSTFTKSGGRFSTANPKSEVDWIIYRAKQTPSAAEYKPRRPQTSSSQRFSSAYPKSYLEWTEYFSKSLPSPNQYRVDGKTRYNVSPEVASGGRFSTSRRPSYIRTELYRVSDHPSPGDYNVTGFRSTAPTLRASASLDPLSPLMDQIRSLDAMTRPKKITKRNARRRLRTSPIKLRSSQQRPSTAL